MRAVVGDTPIVLGVGFVGGIMGTTSSGLMCIPLPRARLDNRIAAIALSGVDLFCWRLQMNISKALNALGSSICCVYQSNSWRL